MAGPQVEFLGHRTNDEVRACYREAAAVLLPGEEEFGIAPVEAQACGRPVVALNRGGVRETVVHGATGFLVDDDTPEAFADALRRARAHQFDTAAIRANALRFSRQQFLAGIEQAVTDLITAPREEARW